MTYVYICRHCHKVSGNMESQARAEAAYSFHLLSRHDIEAS